MFTRATNIKQDQGIHLLYPCSDCNLAREAVVSLNCMHYSAHLAGWIHSSLSFHLTLPTLCPTSRPSLCLWQHKVHKGFTTSWKEKVSHAVTLPFARLLRWLSLHSFLSSCDHDGCFSHLSDPLDQSDVRIRARCVTLPTVWSGRFREACKLTSRLSEVKVMANSQRSHRIRLPAPQPSNLKHKTLS